MSCFSASPFAAPLLAADDKWAARKAQLLDDPCAMRDMSHRDRCKMCVTLLQKGLEDRDTAARAMLLALLAGKNVLLMGPPGTGKSLMCRRLAHLLEATAVERGAAAWARPDDKASEDRIQAAVRFFEIQLTDHTEPAELMGPPDIEALRAGRLEARMEG